MNSLELTLLACPEIVGRVQDPLLGDQDKLCGAPIEVQFTYDVASTHGAVPAAKIMCLGFPPLPDQPVDRTIMGPHHLNGPVDVLWRSLDLADAALKCLGPAGGAERDRLVRLSQSITDAGGDEAVPRLARDYQRQLALYQASYDLVPLRVWDAHFRYWGGGQTADVA